MTEPKERRRRLVVKYRTVVADPPWPIADPRRFVAGSLLGGRGGRRRNHTPLAYDLMTLDEITALPVSEWADVDAHLYLWLPARFNREGTGVAVARAWGFEPVGEIIWAKPSFGMGR